MDSIVVNIVAYNVRYVLGFKSVLLIFNTGNYVLVLVFGKLLIVGFAGVFFVSCKEMFRLSNLYVYSKFYL